jgi:uncharacterized RDD family membrane protein YckC
MQHIRIHTTQNVIIEYRSASVGDRILSNLLDLLIIGVYFISLAILKAWLGLNISLAGWVIFMLPPTFYHLLSELFMDGQTIGMKLIKTKVIRLDGGQPALYNYLLRWMLRLVDVWFGWGAIAVVTIASNGRGQRIGDMAAGTTVISLKQQASLDDTRLPTVEDDYEPIYPQAANLSDRDVGIIRETLRVYENRETSDPVLIETLTRKVKELLGVEEPVAPISFLKTVLRDHTYLTAHA